MKRIIFMVLAVLMIAGQVMAIDWVRSDVINVAWDPVTTLEDGTPIPADDAIRYKIYIWERNGIPQPYVTDVTGENVQITNSQEGFYFIGVQTLRYVMVNGVLETVPETSAIAWSNDATYCLDGNTFGQRFHIPPGNPKNLQKQ